jgi:hypothetical protein
MVSEDICSVDPVLTVNVERPVTTLPSVFEAIAVIAAVPWLTPVTSPGVLAQLAGTLRLAFAGLQTVATDGLLDIHVNWYWPVTLVRFSDTGAVENVPIATNWLVCPG